MSSKMIVKHFNFKYYLIYFKGLICPKEIEENGAKLCDFDSVLLLLEFNLSSIRGPPHLIWN